eukprot:713121-Rhodomonas_salina.1
MALASHRFCMSRNDADATRERGTAFPRQACPCAVQPAFPQAQRQQKTRDVCVCGSGNEASAMWEGATRLRRALHACSTTPSPACEGGARASAQRISGDAPEDAG